MLMENDHRTTNWRLVHAIHYVQRVSNLSFASPNLPVQSHVITQSSDIMTAHPDLNSWPPSFNNCNINIPSCLQETFHYRFHGFEWNHKIAKTPFTEVRTPLCGKLTQINGSRIKGQRSDIHNSFAWQTYLLWGNISVQNHRLGLYSDTILACTKNQLPNQTDKQMVGCLGRWQFTVVGVFIR